MEAKRTAEIVIVGGGLVGCSIAYNLALRGVRDVVVLERQALCSGGSAKSCAIVRTHYTIESNLVHAVESLKILEGMKEIVGEESGFQRTGYLIVGPEEHRAAMEKVFATQRKHGIDAAVLSPAEARKIHPLVAYDEDNVIGYDTRAGYCDPYLTTMAYAKRARDLGVIFHTNTPVSNVTASGNESGFLVETQNRGPVSANVVVLAAGPWTHALAEGLGVEIEYGVSRHKVVTLRGDADYRPDWPVVKDLRTDDKIYIRPTGGGQLLIGTGDYGDPVGSADDLVDVVERSHLERIAGLVGRVMPSLDNAQVTNAWTGPYDITADWNPLVGAVPSHGRLYVAVGYSGHGFKLAPTMSEALAETIIGQEPRVSISDYAVDRFSSGKLLQGAYGEGSIS